MFTVQNFLDNLKTKPVVGPLIRFADERPRLAAWIVLSLGIVILLMIEARDVGLLIGQWVALIVASVLVAGLCIWIVTWEDSDEQAAEAADTTTTTSTTSNTTSTPADDKA
jgi:hypothetical protein